MKSRLKLLLDPRIGRSAAMTYLTLKRFTRKSGLHLLLLGIRISGKKIVLTYDPDPKQDGVGAQIQRILAIYSLANFLKVDYLHTEVSEIAIHPLDPYQNKNDYREFINRLNSFFALPSASPNLISACQKRRLESLRQRDLWKFLRLRRSKNNVPLLISIVNPYLLVDLKPSMYKAVAEFFHSKISSGFDHQKEFGVVGVHYRQGVGGFVVQNGEKFPRQLPMRYFQDAIKERILNVANPVELVKIFTDSPDQNIQFTPPKDQEYLWRDTPRFENHGVEVIASDLSQITLGLPCPSQIKSGGDVLETLIHMTQVESLILSKSSLSYVAAIIGLQREIYYPHGFWHPPLPGWIVL